MTTQPSSRRAPQYAELRPPGRRLETTPRWWTLPVAGSGDRKSTADNEALRGVTEHEKILRTKYDADVQDFLASEAAYNAEKRRIEIRKDKGFTREDRIKALRELGGKPEKPLYPIHTVADPTIEGLIKNWQDLRAGVGLVSAEGGQFTGGHGMAEENRLRTAAHLSCFWDGTPVKRLRAGDGATFLLGRRLSLHLMIQVETANTFLSDPVLRDQGLLSRLLVAAPPSLVGTRYHKPVVPLDEEAIRDFQATVVALLSIPIPLAESKRNEAAPRALSLDDAAAGAFFRFHDHVEGQMGKDGALEALRDVGAKAPENAARIAAILTLMDNIAAPFISEAAMQQGITLSNWYVGEACRLHEARWTDPQLVLAQELLTWLLRSNHGSFTSREILRNGPKKFRTKAALKTTVAILVDHHWVIPGPNGVFGLNPKARAK